MVISQTKLPLTVAQLESFCIQVAHSGHAQAQIKIVDGNIIQAIDEELLKENDNAQDDKERARS